MDVKDLTVWFLRSLQWLIPSKSFNLARISSIENSDATIIESPLALDNVSTILTYWHKDELIKKLVCIPNPVNDDISRRDSSLVKKANIVCIGRWDIRAKNRTVLFHSLMDFLSEVPQYEVFILGSGTDYFEKKLKHYDRILSQRVHIIGNIPHVQVGDYLESSRILFMPSLYESFGIAAAEGVCMGCSIVGTPLESLKYLSAEGFSGTISRGFQKDDVLDALMHDAKKWHDRQYDPKRIAAFWRKKLNRREVANQILNLYTP
jgi:hypothetical protein